VIDRFVTADDGVRLWFTVEGDGPPLVLCHGGPGMWDYLGPLARLLNDEARVTRWEQRGSGRSERRGPYTTARFVADLDGLRAELGYDAWIVGGHSWGATLALQYALTNPARAIGLVYIAGVGLGRSWNAVYHEEADRRLSDQQRARRDELRELTRTPDEEHEYRVLSWAPDFGQGPLAFERASAEADAPFATNYECNAQLNAETKTWDEDSLIARCELLDVPALIMHGERDPRPAWAVNSLAAALPRSELRVVSGAGHQPWVEAPAEVTRHVEAFISRVA
jgi:proline iminopeptidase